MWVAIQFINGSLQRYIKIKMNGEMEDRYIDG
jgi:hypothetical protein